MNTEEFVAQLVAQCPELEPAVNEHKSDNDGEILIHLLVADVLDAAIVAFSASHAEYVTRILRTVNDGLVNGDEAVQNAVAVSFVEDAGWWEDSTAAFIAMWPAELRAEAERQRSGK